MVIPPYTTILHHSGDHVGHVGPSVWIGMGLETALTDLRTIFLTYTEGAINHYELQNVSLFHVGFALILIVQIMLENVRRSVRAVSGPIPSHTDSHTCPT